MDMCRNKITVCLSLLASIALVLSFGAGAEFLPKAESVVIHELSHDGDFIEIYTSKLSESDIRMLMNSMDLKIKTLKSEKRGNCTVFTVETSLGERISIFERRISGEILERFSSMGDVYIYIDKGCAVKGDVELVEKGDFQNLYRVLNYEDLSYELQIGLWQKLAMGALILLIPLSFMFSRIYARKVFFSGISREEKVHRIRRLEMFLPVPLALIILLLLISSDFMDIYDMVMGYFFSYNDTLFPLGFMLLFLVPYALSAIAMVLGYLPYYRKLKKEEIRSERAVKAILLTLALFLLPVLIWVILISNAPEWIAEREGFIVLMFTAFIFAFMTLSPNLFALFQRAEKLENPLRDEIMEFCRKWNVKISDVRVVRGLPENLANAEVSGIIHKYVFLTDFLIEKFSKEEIMAIVAHEIGHLKERHTLISGVVGITYFSTLMLASKLIEPADIGVYGVLALWLSAMFAFFILLGKIMIRLEFRADRIAAKIVGRDSYVRALSKLAEVNVMKRETEKLFNIFTLHPSIDERISQLEKMDD